MDCREVTSRLSAYLDGELEAADARSVEAHLRQCARCAGELRAQTLLRAAIHTHAAPVPDLSDLEARILARLPAVPAKPAAPRSWRRYAWSAGVAAAAAVAAALTALLTHVPAEERLTDVAVSAHMRSLQASHLTEIASPDPGRVRAWLQDRLGLAVPVPDLASQGYELVGGRLDYVYKWKVGAVVYRRDDHVINVFAWPARDGDVHDRALSDEGLHIRFWARAGLNFCAISDLGDDELAHFMRSFTS